MNNQQTTAAQKKQICCLCGDEYTDWGHNAQPVRDGRCCGYCNALIVIPMRMRRLGLGRKEKPDAA